MNAKHIAWSPLMKLSVIILLFSTMVYFLYKFRGGVLPVILACILAYIMSGVVIWLEGTLKLKKAWAIFIAYLILSIIIAALFFLVMPMLFRQLRTLNLNLEELILRINGLMGRRWDLFGVTIDGNRILASLSSSLKDMVSPLFGRSLDVIGQILTSLIWFIFIIVFSIYIVKDGQAMSSWIAQLPPPDYREDYQRLSHEIKTIWGAFFRGQLLLSIIVMVILTLVGIFIGLPYALLMGFIGGVLEFFPSLGHGIWLVLSIILALAHGSDWIPLPHWAFALVVVGMTAIFDQVDNNYLIPRIIGRSVRLPALVVLLGIVIGASVAGVLGVALAAPTIASFRVVGRYIYSRLFDLDPFPVVEELCEPLPPPVIRWWHHRPSPAPPSAGPDQGSQ